MSDAVIQSGEFHEHAENEAKASKPYPPWAIEDEPGKRGIEGESKENSPRVSPGQGRLDEKADAKPDGDEQDDHLHRQDRESKPMQLHGMGGASLTRSP